MWRAGVPVFFTLAEPPLLVALGPLSCPPVCVFLNGFVCFVFVEHGRDGLVGGSDRRRGRSGWAAGRNKHPQACAHRGNLHRVSIHVVGGGFTTAMLRPASAPRSLGGISKQAGIVSVASAQQYFAFQECLVLVAEDVSLRDKAPSGMVYA